MGCIATTAVMVILMDFVQRLNYHWDKLVQVQGPPAPIRKNYSEYTINNQNFSGYPASYLFTLLMLLGTIF